VVLRERDKGHTRFKLKTGFGRDLDIRNLAAMRRAAGADTTLMADANQAWDYETAVAMSRALNASGPIWLEEPMPATTPVETWARFAAETPIPLALGENLRGMDGFEAAIAGAGIAFLQPDAGKWGGISACLPLAERTLAAGISYCPHWLGGAVGLMVSLHLLAAIGGPGLLEIDVNPNPLRDALCPGLPAIEAGTMTVPPAPGIGVEPDPGLLARYRVAV
jgi:L-alanine-DL-glutamate epimerase-like enolase superfamily enzyme